VRSLYLLHLSRAYCLPLPRPAPSLLTRSLTAPPITAWNCQWRSDSLSPLTDTLVVYIPTLPAFFKAPLTPLALTFSTQQRSTCHRCPSPLLAGVAKMKGTFFLLLALLAAFALAASSSDAPTTSSLSEYTQQVCDCATNNGK
jgi:hypothetical protein